MKAKYIFRSVTAGNLLLAIAAAYMAYWLVMPSISRQAPSPLKVQTSPAKMAEGVRNEFSAPSPADYAIIAEENLFHPERIIPPEKKAEQELPKPDFILYGTLVSEDASLAFIEDLKAPRLTPGRGKRQIVLKRGDMLSGFVLKEIEQDRIIMVRGEDRIAVSVRDAQKPKTRAAFEANGRQPPAQEFQRGSAPPVQPEKTQRAARTPVKSEPPSVGQEPFKSPVDEKMRQLFQR